MIQLLNPSTIFSNPQSTPSVLKAPEVEEFVLPAFKGDTISYSHGSSWGFSKMGIVNMPVGALNQNPALAPEFQELRYNPKFLTIYRNFDQLSNDRQTEVLTKLSLMIQKYPNFLDTLVNVDNNFHGNGFQFFFVPRNNPDRLATIPTPVKNMGGGSGTIGIVFGLPTEALIQSPLIGKGINTLASLATKAVSHFKPSLVELETGGMYNDTYSSGDLFSHEMGHVLHAHFMDRDQLAEVWAIFSQAEANDEGFISHYSRTNHMEFFAEGVEAYLEQNSKGEFIGRDKLKKVNPALFDFVQRMLEPGIDHKGPDAFNSAAEILKYKAKLPLEKAFEGFQLQCKCPHKH